jgi:diaminopimelate decarboxylase
METAETSETEGTIKDRSEEKHGEPLTRDQVLRLSSEVIRKLHTRVNGVRFKEQSGDNARLSHVRALAQLLQLYGSILKDHEITELETRITELEKAKEGRNRT